MRNDPHYCESFSLDFTVVALYIPFIINGDNVIKVAPKDDAQLCYNAYHYPIAVDKLFHRGFT